MESNEHKIWKCEIETGSMWYKHKCGNPIVGTLKDGTPACKFHLGVEKRKATVRAQTEAAEANRKMRAAEARHKALTESDGVMGIHVQKETLSDGSEVYNVMVPGSTFACQDERSAYYLVKAIIDNAVGIEARGE